MNFKVHHSVVKTVPYPDACAPLTFKEEDEEDFKTSGAEALVRRFEHIPCEKVPPSISKTNWPASFGLTTSIVGAKAISCPHWTSIPFSSSNIIRFEDDLTSVPIIEEPIEIDRSQDR